MNDMTRLDSNSNDSPPLVQPAKPLSLRDSLTARFGAAVGEMMYAVELEARRKAAEQFQELQARLTEINAQIEIRLRANAESLEAFTARMESSYTQYLRDYELRDEEMLRAQASLVDYATQRQNSSRRLTHRIRTSPARSRIGRVLPITSNNPILPPMPEIGGPGGH